MNAGEIRLTGIGSSSLMLFKSSRAVTALTSLLPVRVPQNNDESEPSQYSFTRSTFLALYTILWIPSFLFADIEDEEGPGFPGICFVLAASH